MRTFPQPFETREHADQVLTLLVEDGYAEYVKTDRFRALILLVTFSSLRWGEAIAAQSGASLRDLMDRMGHDSVRAAMIYQHGSSEAGKLITDAMDAKIKAAQHDQDDDGAAGALVPA